MSDFITLKCWHEMRFQARLSDTEIIKYSDEDESTIIITERWTRLLWGNLGCSTGRATNTHSNTLGAILELKDETKKKIETKECAAPLSMNNYRVEETR